MTAKVWVSVALMPIFVKWFFGVTYNYVSGILNICILMQKKYWVLKINNAWLSSYNNNKFINVNIVDKAAEISNLTCYHKIKLKINMTYWLNIVWPNYDRGIWSSCSDDFSLSLFLLSKNKSFQTGICERLLMRLLSHWWSVTDTVGNCNTYIIVHLPGLKRSYVESLITVVTEPSDYLVTLITW